MRRIILFLICLLLLPLSSRAETSTICTSGCDYTTLFNWEAGEDGAITEPEIAEITEGFLDATAFTIDGFTGNTADNYIKIYTTAAARHDGKWDTGAYRLEASVPYGNLFRTLESHIKIDGLQFHNSSATDCAGMTYALAITGHEVSNCIVKTAGDAEGILMVNTAITMKIWNTIVYNVGSQGSFARGIYADNSSSVDIYNCTVYNYGRGIEQDTGTMTVTNSAVFGNAWDFDGTMTILNCASDDGTGTNPVTPADWSAVFEDYTNGDFHLKSTDTDLHDAGTDNPGEGLYSDDIDGETRVSTWDIGADEYVGAAAARRIIFCQ